MIDLPSDAKKISLTKSQLRTDVEVELRKAGIPVLTVDKIFTAPGMSHLYVYVNPVALTGILKGAYTFHVSVNLVQMTDLRRNQSIEAYAPTWNRNKTGSGGGNKTKKGIREIVRDFVN